jgi:hypothetical protein
VAHNSAPCSSTEAGLTSMAPRAATPRLRVLRAPPRQGLFAPQRWVLLPTAVGTATTAVSAATHSGWCCLTYGGPVLPDARRPRLSLPQSALGCCPRLAEPEPSPRSPPQAQGLPPCCEGVFACNPTTRVPLRTSRQRPRTHAWAKPCLAGGPDPPRTARNVPRAITHPSMGEALFGGWTRPPTHRS